MTVAELIRALSMLDPDLPVRTDGGAVSGPTEDATVTDADECGPDEWTDYRHAYLFTRVE